MPGIPFEYFDSTIRRISASGVPFSNSRFASRAMSMQIPQPKPIGSGDTRGFSPVVSIASTKQS